MIVLWIGVLALGIALLDWGSARAADLVGRWRGALGLPGTAAGAFLGLATALPEVSVGVAATLFAWPDLGLGAALGSNVPAIPFAFVLAWAATAWPRRGDTAGPAVARPQAVAVQVAPYLAVVCLLAALTLPPGWAGLQPIDALILLGAFGLFLALALSRPRKADREAPQAEAGLGWAALGALALVAGALAAVIAARRVTDALGLPDLVGGLFAVGFLCALPESAAAFRLARQDMGTVAISAACTDGVVSLTLALVAPALAGAPIGQTGVYLLNLGFLAAMLVLYMVVNRGGDGQPFDGRRAALFGGAYLAYMAATLALLSRGG